MTDLQREEWLALVRRAKDQGQCPYGGGRVFRPFDSKGFGPGLACVVCDCFAQPYADLVSDPPDTMAP